MSRYKKKSILNKTRKKKLVNLTKLCLSASSQTRGLMFSGFIDNKALIFDFKKSRNISLHMFFVFFPIDLIFLDSKYKVVELKKGFMPFTFYKSNKKARYLIELSLGVIDESNTQIGDILKF